MHVPPPLFVSVLCTWPAGLNFLSSCFYPVQTLCHGLPVVPNHPISLEDVGAYEVIRTCRGQRGRKLYSSAAPVTVTIHVRSTTFQDPRRSGLSTFYRGQEFPTLPRLGPRAR